MSRPSSSGVTSVRITLHQTTFSAVCITVLFLSVPTDTALGQNVRLSATVGKEVFFEGEPIYGLFELRNEGTDTAWVGIFGFAPDRLTVSLRRSDGVVVPEARIWAEYAIPPGWRGSPIAPRERKFQMLILQNTWGEPVKPTWTMFPGHIPPGEYTLVATFNAAVESQPWSEASIAAPPLTIIVRPRTPAEDRSFVEVERVCAKAWDRTTRATYFGTLLALIDERLAADSTDPFAAFLVNDAVTTGRGVGLTLAPGDAARLTAARMVVARAQRSRPAGAMAAVTAFADAPTGASVADLLGPSLAATVVREQEKARRTPVRRPGN